MIAKGRREIWRGYLTARAVRVMASVGRDGCKKTKEEDVGRQFKRYSGTSKVTWSMAGIGTVLIIPKSLTSCKTEFLR